MMVGFRIIRSPLTSWLRETTYGFSKAILNVFTVSLAQQHPALLVNALTPGFCDTDLVRGVVATRVGLVAHA